MPVRTFYATPKKTYILIFKKKFENELAILNNYEGKNMLQGCFKIKPKCVLPKEVIQSSVEFWKKYFKKRFDISTLDELIEMKIVLKIEENVRWYSLEKKFE